jgi:uncharacterized protein YigE (DUF2233 family)
MHPSIRIRPVAFPRLFLLAVTCLLPTAAPAQSLQWERLAEGLEVSVWKPGAACIDVPPSLVTDIDPQRYRFSVHFYAQEGLDQPPTIEDWQKRTGHHLLFNAGLFRENFSYLGLLYKDGRSLGSRRHATWQGLFVAEPTSAGNANARVLDLSVDGFDEQRLAYKEAAQALMLLDRTGNIRVRQTGKRAFQTAVAETGAGHILVVKSLDPVALYDLAQCVKDRLPFVRQVMAMDGGSSSDLLIPESLWKGSEQNHSTWKSLFAGTTSIHIPLPAVIGISPR